MIEILSSINNKEYAIIIIIIIGFIWGILKRDIRDSIKDILRLLMNYRMIVLFIVFLLSFTLSIYILTYIGYWEIKLFKDAVLWLWFAEMPLAYKSIQKASDIRFFKKMIFDNLSIIVLLTFIMNIWTFSISIELVILIISFILGLIYYMLKREKKHLKQIKILEGLFGGLIIGWLLYSIFKTIVYYKTVINLLLLKQLLLPVILLILNLPFLYLLSVFSQYESIFTRIGYFCKYEIRFKLVCYIRLNLNKAYFISKNLHHLKSCEDNVPDRSFQYLRDSYESNTGENYMNRSKYYVLMSLIGLVISIYLLIYLKGYSYQSIINYLLLKEESVYIGIAELSTIVFSISLIYYLGYSRKKYEEIITIKKIILSDFVNSLKVQNQLLLDFIPTDSPSELLKHYIVPAYELNRSSRIVINHYEHLLKSWEYDTISKLELKSGTILSSLHTDKTELMMFSASEFESHYKSKLDNSIQNDVINIFENMLQNDIKSYQEYIKLALEDFKIYLSLSLPNVT